MTSWKHRPRKPGLDTMEKWRAFLVPLLVQGALALVLVALATWGP